ncbi:hypothetical protein [Pseudomonas sp. GV047]|uniref:hypothetical protein n=1 Tax=Pseudomonas sp. GV047 TaxID=2135751 RepID=UPI000D336961|nr:hypothetical protein [Pseudomonas sp. GV047]PUB40054.1 hypothetical protein C8K58_11440 [Pseudomonas sp. GV047]
MYAKSDIQAWVGIFEGDNPSDSNVGDEWKSFKSFKTWFDNFQVSGWVLNKDLIKPGNTTYNPATCCYVPHYIHELIIYGTPDKGSYPRGVITGESPGKFAAHIKTSSGSRVEGSCDTPEEAHKLWQLKKARAISSAIARYQKEASNDDRVLVALWKFHDKIESDRKNNIETTHYSH